jgi:hypothetical protein
MPARKKTEMDYFQEGQEAHRSGKPKTANPYGQVPRESSYFPEIASYWDQGWDSEQEVSHGDA